MSKYFKDVQRLAQDIAQQLNMPFGKVFFEECYTLERNYECVISENMLELLLNVRDRLEKVGPEEPKENPDQLTLF